MENAPNTGWTSRRPATNLALRQVTPLILVCHKLWTYHGKPLMPTIQLVLLLGTNLSTIDSPIPALTTSFGGKLTDNFQYFISQDQHILSTALAVVWTAVYLTGYRDHLTGKVSVNHFCHLTDDAPVWKMSSVITVFVAKEWWWCDLDLYAAYSDANFGYPTTTTTTKSATHLPLGRSSTSCAAI